MEDRRCRKVMATLLTTVIILSVSVQNAYAASEKTTDKLFNRAIDFKQTIFQDMVSGFREIIEITKEENQFLRTFMNLKEQVKEDTVVFVVEQAPLDAVLGTDRQSKSAVTTNASRSIGSDMFREDLELLARIIHAEARGESFEGQVAVGAVVLNRVQHPDFPKSIKDVIYQPGQFTAVDDRQINLVPDERAYQAAQAALEGQDPSNGAIFYYNPKIATDPWIRTRSIIRSIGNHKFCV